jgi:hypothetical protein
MGVQDETRLFQGRPEGLVGLVNVGGLVEPAGRDHHAAQAEPGGDMDLLHGLLDPGSDRHDGHADPAVRVGGAEVGQPAVVGAGAGLHGLGIRVDARSQPRAEGGAAQAAGSEHVRVGEEDLGRHALLVEDGIAYGGIVGGLHLVVARLLVPLFDELRGHHALRGQPGLVFVELGPEGLFQVVAVDLGRWAGVAVSRNDQVRRHEDPFS